MYIDALRPCSYFARIYVTEVACDFITLRARFCWLGACQKQPFCLHAQNVLCIALRNQDCARQPGQLAVKTRSGSRGNHVVHMQHRVSIYTVLSAWCGLAQGPWLQGLVQHVCVGSSDITCQTLLGTINWVVWLR